MRTHSIILAACFFVIACDKGNEATSPVASGSASTTSMTSASASAGPAMDPAALAAMQADEESAADELQAHHRHHHHGGIAMFIHMAIDSLGVAPEKKVQLEKIQSDLHAKMAPSRDASRAVLTIVADGIAAGTIDNAKVDAAVAKQEAASANVHAATADALNQLHAALSAEERAALVDKVKAHAEVWKKVNLEEHGSKEKGSHLAKMTTLLALTPDQVDKISTALKKDAPPKPDTTAIDAHLTAFETAFVADTFDAKTLTTANAANAAISKHGEARMVRFYKIATPVLTPEQRTKLAAHVRERLDDKSASK